MSKIIHKNIETQRRLAKLCHKTGRYKGEGFTFARIYFDDFDWGDKEPRNRYMNDGNGKRFKSLKKYGNRKIRYYKGDLKDGRHCYKIYEAKWELY